ncbi:MAG: TetR/AcrR family transcriptional regulator [Pseudomonadota bacterium]
MASDLVRGARRVPQQQRAAARLETILQAAGLAIAQHGYQAATMTHIAALAGTSIGALYQYFPNKEALAHSLRTQYADRMDARWSELASGAQGLPLAELVARLFDLMLDFLRTHPACMELINAPMAFQRDQQLRDRLLRRFAQLFVQRQPTLAPDEAYLIANVTLQIVRSLNPLYQMAADVPARARLAAEFQAAVTSYLRMRLA